MTWSAKRQTFYILILMVFIFTFGFLIISPYFKKAPTCFDGKQNGIETGVDCGGDCLRACVAKVDAISLLWARSFEVVKGRYNAIAYLENHNTNTAAEKVAYRFRFADKNNLYIGKREGVAYIPPTGKFAIFEPAIDVGYSIPVYTTFEFLSKPNWVTVSMEKINQLQISISEILLSDDSNSSILSALVENKSLFTIPNMNFIAILYDANHNALSVSRTYLETLNKQEKIPISFTWPSVFSEKVVSKEILPLYNIFSAKLK